MIWSLWTLVFAAAVAVGWATAALISHINEVRASLRRDNAVRATRQFELCVERLDSLRLYHQQRLPGGPSAWPAQRPEENVWDYYRTLALLFFPDVALPLWAHFEYTRTVVKKEKRMVQLTVRTVHWYAQVGHIMHRVGRLKHGDTESHVLLCAPVVSVLRQLVVEAEDYMPGQPIVTCVLCRVSPAP